MNIIFDVDETLYDMVQPFERAFKELWQDKYDIDMYALYAASRVHSDKVFDQVMAGTMTVDGAGVYRMTHAMEDFGFAITEEEALEFQHAYRKHQQHLDISETIPWQSSPTEIPITRWKRSGGWVWNAGFLTTKSLSPTPSDTSSRMCAPSGR